MWSEGIAPPFLTSALDEDEWLASDSPRFIPGERAPVSIEKKAEWTSELVWTLWRRENLDHAENRSST
jgi:hypothetical protein